MKCIEIISMGKNCAYKTTWWIKIVMGREFFPPIHRNSEASQYNTLSRHSETMLTLLLTLTCVYSVYTVKVSFFAIFDYHWRRILVDADVEFFFRFYIRMHFVGVYQKERSVCHLLGRSTLWLGANIKQKSRTVRERDRENRVKREEERERGTSPFLLVGQFLVCICVYVLW